MPVHGRKEHPVSVSRRRWNSFRPRRAVIAEQVTLTTFPEANLGCSPRHENERPMTVME
jgi:hypothetical protein